MPRIGFGYGLGRGGGGEAVNSFILPGTPFAVYSLRQLDGYSGNAIRVRRSSDDAEMDIGFSNYQLDLNTLQTFVGASDGCIKTFYDQVGSNNFTQLTNANQPKIISAGTLLMVNNSPSIYFGTQANQWFLDSPSGFLYNEAAFSIFATWQMTDWSGSNAGIFAPSTVTGQGIEILQKNVTPLFYHAQLILNSSTRNAGGTAGRLFNNNTQTNNSIFGDNVSVSAYKRGVAVSLSNTNAIVPLTYNGIYSLGRNSVGYMNGHVQEFILYTSNESANRTTIESMVNNFYQIY